MCWFSQALYRYFVVFSMSEEGAIKVPKPHWPPVTPYHHFIWLTPSPSGGLRWSLYLTAFSAKFCSVLTTSVFPGLKISPCLEDCCSWYTLVKEYLPTIHQGSAVDVFDSLRAGVWLPQRASFILEELTGDLKLYQGMGDGRCCCRQGTFLELELDGMKKQG